MAYPGIALVAMVGVGLGLALWYFLTDTTGEHPHSSGPPQPPSRRDSSSTVTNWGSNNDTRRRRPRSNSKAKEDCAICTEAMDIFAETLKCGHVFHRSCISKWSEFQGKDSRGMVTCPLCRRSI